MALGQPRASRAKNAHSRGTENSSSASGSAPPYPSLSPPPLSSSPALTEEEDLWLRGITPHSTMALWFLTIKEQLQRRLLPTSIGRLRSSRFQPPNRSVSAHDSSYSVGKHGRTPSHGRDKDGIGAAGVWFYDPFVIPESVTGNFKKEWRKKGRVWPPSLPARCAIRYGKDGSHASRAHQNPSDSPPSLTTSTPRGCRSGPLTGSPEIVDRHQFSSLRHRGGGTGGVSRTQDGMGKNGDSFHDSTDSEEGGSSQRRNSREAAAVSLRSALDTSPQQKKPSSRSAVKNKRSRKGEKNLFPDFSLSTSISPRTPLSEEQRSSNIQPHNLTISRKTEGMEQPSEKQKRQEKKKKKNQPRSHAPLKKDEKIGEDDSPSAMATGIPSWRSSDERDRRHSSPRLDGMVGQSVDVSPWWDEGRKKTAHTYTSSSSKKGKARRRERNGKKMGSMQNERKQHDGIHLSSSSSSSSSSTSSGVVSTPFLWTKKMGNTAPNEARQSTPSNDSRGPPRHCADQKDASGAPHTPSLVTSLTREKSSAEGEVPTRHPLLPFSPRRDPVGFEHGSLEGGDMEWNGPKTRTSARRKDSRVTAVLRRLEIASSEDFSSDASSWQSLLHSSSRETSDGSETRPPHQTPPMASWTASPSMHSNQRAPQTHAPTRRRTTSGATLAGIEERLLGTQRKRHPEASQDGNAEHHYHHHRVEDSAKLFSSTLPTIFSSSSAPCPSEFPWPLKERPQNTRQDQLSQHPTHEGNDVGRRPPQQENRMPTLWKRGMGRGGGGAPTMDVVAWRKKSVEEGPYTRLHALHRHNTNRPSLYEAPAEEKERSTILSLRAVSAGDLNASLSVLDKQLLRHLKQVIHTHRTMEARQRKAEGKSLSEWQRSPPVSMVSRHAMAGDRGGTLRMRRDSDRIIPERKKGAKESPWTGAMRSPHGRGGGGKERGREWHHKRGGGREKMTAEMWEWLEDPIGGGSSSRNRVLEEAPRTVLPLLSEEGKAFAQQTQVRVLSLSRSREQEWKQEIPGTNWPTESSRAVKNEDSEKEWRTHRAMNEIMEELPLFPPVPVFPLRRLHSPPRSRTLSDARNSRRSTMNQRANDSKSRKRSSYDSLRKNSNEEKWSTLPILQSARQSLEDMQRSRSYDSPRSSYVKA